MSRYPVGREGLRPPRRAQKGSLSSNRSRAGWPLVVACGALSALACGVQGPPRPPRVEQPEAVRDLAAWQVGRTVELSFTLPALATDGERLSRPLEAQIFRHITSPREKPPSQPAESDPWLTLLPEDLSRSARGEKIVFPALLSDQEFKEWRGATFTFALRTLTRGFRHRPVVSEFSNPVHLTLLSVTGPVQGLQVHGSEEAIELSWSPPAGQAGGQPLGNLAGYQVYRSRTGKPASFQRLGETGSPTYSDPDFEFSRTYFYKVRALFKEAGQAAESEDSTVVEIAPRDVFPPATPTQLSGIYTTQAVELIWKANSEADLAGYNIYRREQEGPYHKVNAQLLGTPLFRDPAVAPGSAYSYRVTALDLAGNESEPSAETGVETK